MGRTVEEIAAELAPKVGFDVHQHFVLPEENLIWRLGYAAALWKAVALHALGVKHG